MLRGRTIAITRPLEQSGTLAEAIFRQGGTPLLAPLLAIEPIPDNPDLVRAAQSLDEFSVAIFISPNSVEHSLPVLLHNRSWPAGLRAAAVGPGTRRVLAGHGIHNCLLPEAPHYDSEGLLACAPLAESVVAGRKILLLRGVGGRELLADTLTHRGAGVVAISCYRRVAPVDLLQPFKTAWSLGQLDGIVVSSSESLANLLAAVSSEADFLRLASIPMFVPHPRIAEKALAAGIALVVLTPPAEEGMLSGLLAYNWPDQTKPLPDK